MSTTRDKSGTARRTRRPMYARLLRLKHVQPGSLLCALYFEGSVFVGALLAFAELVPWWVAVLLPIVVAVMVKLNDVIAGAVTDSPESEGIESDRDAMDEGDDDTADADDGWEPASNEVAGEPAEDVDEPTDEATGEVTSGELAAETGRTEESRAGLARGDQTIDPMDEPGAEVAPASGRERNEAPEQPGHVPAEPVSRPDDPSTTGPDQQAGTAGRQAAVRPDAVDPPGEPDTARTSDTDGVPDLTSGSGDTGAAHGGDVIGGSVTVRPAAAQGAAGQAGAGEEPTDAGGSASLSGETGSGALDDEKPAVPETSPDTGMATAGWLRVAGGLDHTTEFSAIVVDADGTPLPPGTPDREPPPSESALRSQPQNSSRTTPQNGTDGYDPSGPASPDAAPVTEAPDVAPPSAEAPVVAPPSAEVPGTSPPRAEVVGETPPHADGAGGVPPRAEVAGETPPHADGAGGVPPRAEVVGETPPHADGAGEVPPRADEPGTSPPSAEEPGVLPPGPRRPAGVPVDVDGENGQAPAEPVRGGAPTWRSDATGEG